MAKTTSLIVALGGKPGATDEYDETKAAPDEDESEATSYKECATDIRHALHDRDDDALVTALLRFVDLANGNLPREESGSETELPE